jgi:hypothetical protein
MAGRNRPDDTPDYPGTPRHQALLRAVADHYAGDPRVLAVAVFGSLGRGTWDNYSDLDLDVVTTDEARIDPRAELARLCASFAPLGESALLVVPDGEDAGDVVLGSLLELSVRYHPLRATSPNIVDSLRLLTGRIDAGAIRAAGLANRRPPGPLADALDRFARLAVGADVALQRRQFWRALQLLELLRGMLLVAFSRSRGGARPYHVFQAEADAALQARLGATLPRHSLRSAQEALAALLDIAERDLGALSNGGLRLSAAHRAVLARVRERQATLDLPDAPE